MDNYEDKSDFEINKAVAEALGIKEPYSAISPELWLEWDALDYCNNPSDAWPIIIENDIVFERRGHYGLFSAWHRKHLGSEAWMREHSTFSKNVLRAMMIVFLKMQEAK